MFKIFLFIIALALLLFPAQAQTEYVRIVGTKVNLVIPTGFSPATRFSGLQNETLNASVLIAEFTFDATQKQEIFSDERFAASGMKLLSKQSLPENKQNRILFNVLQKQSGGTFLKWILFIGEADNSVSLTATFPEKYKEQVSQKLKDTLLSAKWDPQEKEDFTEGLNYSVTETDNLKVSQRISNMLLFTLHGSTQIQSIDKPILVFAQSYSEVLITNRREFANQRARIVATVKAIKIQQTKPIKVDGLTGYETFSTGKDTSTDKPVFLYQAILFEPNGYYISGATVGAENKNKYLADFKMITNSFKRHK